MQLRRTITLYLFEGCDFQSDEKLDHEFQRQLIDEYLKLAPGEELPQATLNTEPTP